MQRLEDLMDAEAAQMVRALQKEAADRVSQTVVNYRFGAQVLDRELSEGDIEVLVHLMTLTFHEILSEWNGTDAMIPAIMATYAIREVLRGEI